MRKVTQQIVNAFTQGKKKVVANTMTDGESVFLHGNCICRRINGRLYFTLAGWNTSTTRNRCNALGAHFAQHKHDAVWITFSQSPSGKLLAHRKSVDANCWYDEEGNHTAISQGSNQKGQLYDITD